MEKSTKYFLIGLGLLSALLVFKQLGVQVQTPPQASKVISELPQGILTKAQLLIGDQPLEVEVATTSLELASGLSYREQLGSEGMLFVLPNRGRVGFWMKGMKFDLDLIWIRDHKITEITPHVLASSYEKNRQLYFPVQAVDLVLELPADQAAALGFKVGDPVRFQTGP